MRKILIAGALCAALAGCSAAQVTEDVASINAIVASLNTPAALQAEANMRALYGGTICGIASLSALTAAVAIQVKATATVNGATIVAGLSSTLCAAANGVVLK
jgi:chaperone required for assembly of F1-ATPase